MRGLVELLGHGRWLRGRERGQMLIVFAMLIVPVTFAIGVAAVDASMWQSERRGAQKDADLAALAGALQLAIDNSDKDGARDAAQATANVNDESGNAPTPGGNCGEPNAGHICVDRSCFSGNNVFANNAVDVNLRHDTRSFFAHFFGDGLTPNVGAHAKACVGSIVGAGSAAPRTGFGMIDLLPIVIDNNDGDCFSGGEPDYGSSCVIEYGSSPCENPDTDPDTATGCTDGHEDFRTVDLVDSDDTCSDYAGGDDFRVEDFIAEQIELGVQAHCLLDDDDDCGPSVNGPWSDCIIIRAIDPHDNSSSDTDDDCYAFDPTDWCDLMAGFQARLTRTCGLDADEAYAAVRNPGDNLYEAIECPSAAGRVHPRLAAVFVVDELPEDIRQNYYPGAFAPDVGRRGKDNEGFDVRAIATVFVEECFYKDTDPPESKEPPYEDWSESCEHMDGADLFRIRVRFVRLLTQGEIGPPDESATNVGIALGE